MLDNYLCELVVEDSSEDYRVVTDEETDSNPILRNSVMRNHRGQHDILPMKNKPSFKQTVEQGVIRVEKLEVNAENLKWKTNGS